MAARGFAGAGGLKLHGEEMRYPQFRNVIISLGGNYRGRRGDFPGNSTLSLRNSSLEMRAEL